MQVQEQEGTRNIQPKPIISQQPQQPVRTQAPQAPKAPQVPKAQVASPTQSPRASPTPAQTPSPKPLQLPQTPPSSPKPPPSPTPAPQQYKYSAQPQYQPTTQPIPAQRPMTQPPPKAKKPIITIVVIICAVLIMIFMGLALILPWYVQSYETSELEISKTDVDYTLTTYKNPNFLEGDMDEIPWSEVKSRESTAAVYNTTYYLTLIGLILGILFLIGGILSIKYIGKTVTLLIGLLAAICCVLAPIFFMFMHTDGIKSDITNPEGAGPHETFMGYTEENIDVGVGIEVEMKTSWGPSLGWYFAIVGFISALIGFIFAIKLPTKEEKATYKYAKGSIPAAQEPTPEQPYFTPTQQIPGYGQVPQQPPEYGQPPQYPGY